MREAYVLTSLYLGWTKRNIFITILVMMSEESSLGKKYPPCYSFGNIHIAMVPNAPKIHRLFMYINLYLEKCIHSYILTHYHGKCYFKIYKLYRNQCLSDFVCCVFWLESRAVEMWLRQNAEIRYSKKLRGKFELPNYINR